MSAIIDLTIYCGAHPEIRAHKELIELLRETDNEFFQLRLNIERLKENLKEAKEIIYLADKLIDESMHDSYYSTCDEYNQNIARINEYIITNLKEE